MSAKPVKVSSLAELKLVKREIEAQAAREALHQAELARAQQKAASEKDLFKRAAGVVQPVPDKRRAVLKKTPLPPKPMQIVQNLCSI